MAFNDWEIIPFTSSQDDPNISAITRKIVYPVLRSNANTNFIQRRAKWTRPMYEYEISNMLMNDTARELLRNFFMSHEQGVYAFLFSDPFFKTVIKNDFGVGDAAEDTFQLKLVFEYGSRSFSHNATMIAPASETIYIDNVAQDPGDYTLDDETGIIVFDTPPGGTLELSASFDFYRKVISMTPIEISHTIKVISDSRYSLREVI